MKTIEKIRLSNFKKFEQFEVDFDSEMNILIGDNEAGKSSILTALDLALSGSRSKVDSAGIESLLNIDILARFFSEGARSVGKLPTMFVEIYLSDQGNPELNGKNNSLGKQCDGLRMVCAPMDEFGKEIADILAQPGENFPFEYYAVRFLTFADQPYSGYSKYIRHLLIDSSQINHEYATREYTKSMYGAHASALQKYKFQNEYRKHKTLFRTDILAELNDTLSDYKFTVRNNAKSNLETDLVITEGDIPIENKGKGKQCLIKTEFALKKNAGTYTLDAILLEEPENHLSHLNTKKLIQSIRESKTKQIFLATHSSLICTRLDLRKVVMLNSSSGIPLLLNGLSVGTADFFMKAPDNSVLEFILSKKVILVEGDAEFILMEAFYKKVTWGRTPEQDDVHVISVGGTSFKRYLELAKALEIKTAVIRDNDGDHQKNCIDSYSSFAGLGHVEVFADPSNARRTFEICMYEDNTAACDELFARGRKSLPVQDYMLKNKADAAFELLDKKEAVLATPPYIQKAIEWVRT
ncbi:AAA15 family ATPase/GTPase [Duganella sp. 1411]|uniref:ATP-dependent nuclease n=1 Tax=Duganella sp. 1411 TaxID=2806572 RepID=UPI001AE7F3AF|nr:AAA family ATPase [Duganella sp. 1411]MBP1205788.1 AAA15 family ATPase/GTPase [Duganella sp. 1411]